MKYFSFLFNTIISLALIFLLNNRIATSEKILPAFGKILNPMSGLWNNADNIKEYQDLIIDSEELDAEVVVKFDIRMVPHIYAENISDLFFAQGYVEAYLRLWQMDISWRSAAGRISEVVGKKALKRDIWKRKLELNIAAEKAVENWKNYESGSYNICSSYINGINHFIHNVDKKDLPVEFKLLDYEPESWDFIKSALIQKSMGQVLASHANDIAQTNAQLSFDENEYRFLYPTLDQKQKPIIHPSKSYEFDEVLTREKPQDVDYKGPVLKDINVIPSIPGLGSNNWAVSTEKSKTSHPILANDPHLRLTLPSIWCEMQLNAPGINAYGVTIPGIPGIIIGFNENIAWGMTNVGHDVRDFFALNWVDENKTQYEADGKVMDITSRIEKIKVAKSEDYNLEIKETIFGSIYYESDNNDVPDLAQHWLITDEPSSDELRTFVDVLKCKNYSEYKQATSHFETPAQNFLFASKEGTIALRINGKLPLKYEEEGQFVKNANSSNNKWDDFIPRDQNPQYENPPEGFIGSANQVSANQDYPYYFNGRFEDFRGRRVYDELEKRNAITVKDMQEMQMDDYSLKAEFILPIMLDALETQNSRSLLLSKWNMRYRADLETPSFFEKWYEIFTDHYWDELKQDHSLPLPAEWRRLEIYASEDRDIYSDIISTPEKETFKDVINKSFNEMNEYFDNNNEVKMWKDYRPFSIQHLAAIPGFGTQALSVSGHGDALNANSYSGAGPSWRMIVELGDKPNAIGVIPGGQSGNPASPFYSNGVELWESGNYYDLKLYNTPEDQGTDVLFNLNLHSND